MGGPCFGKTSCGRKGYWSNKFMFPFPSMEWKVETTFQLPLCLRVAM